MGEISTSLIIEKQARRTVTAVDRVLTLYYQNIINSISL